MRVFAILLAGAVLLAGADGSDPVELGKRSSKAMAENRPNTRQYAFREYYVNREVNAAGKETDRETETWDIIGLEGYSYRKLVGRNEKAAFVEGAKARGSAAEGGSRAEAKGIARRTQKECLWIPVQLQHALRQADRRLPA